MLSKSEYEKFKIATLRIEILEKESSHSQGLGHDYDDFGLRFSEIMSG